MLKSIEGRQMFQRDEYHVRFFRIVFNSGKLIVKQDRRDKNMRSFTLSQI